MGPITDSPGVVDKTRGFEDFQEDRQRYGGNGVIQDHSDVPSATLVDEKDGSVIRPALNATSAEIDLVTNGHSASEGMIIEISDNDRPRSSVGPRESDRVQREDAEYYASQPNSLSQGQPGLHRNPPQVSELLRGDSSLRNGHQESSLVYRQSSIPMGRFLLQGMDSPGSTSNLTKGDVVIPRITPRSPSNPIGGDDSVTTKGADIAQTELGASGPSAKPVLAPSPVVTYNSELRSPLHKLNINPFWAPSSPQEQTNEPLFLASPQAEIQPPLQKSAKFYIAVPSLPEGLTKDDYSWPPQSVTNYQSKSNTGDKKTRAGKRKRAVKKLRATDLEPPPNVDAPSMHASAPSSSSNHLPSNIDLQNYEEYVCPPPLLELDPNILEAHTPVSNTAIFLSTRHLHQSLAHSSYSPPSADHDHEIHPPDAQDTEYRQDHNSTTFLSAHYTESAMFPHFPAALSRQETTASSGLAPTSFGARNGHLFSHLMGPSNSLEGMLDQQLPQTASGTSDYYVPSIDDAIHGDGTLDQPWMSNVGTFEEHTSYVANGTVDPSLLGGYQAPRSPSPSPPPSTPPAESQLSQRTSQTMSTRKVSYTRLPLMDESGSGSESEFDDLDKEDSMFHPSWGTVSNITGRRSSRTRTLTWRAKDNFLKSVPSIAGPSKTRPLGELAIVNGSNDPFSHSASQRGRGNGRGKGRGRRGTSQSTSNITPMSNSERTPDGDNSLRGGDDRGHTEARPSLPAAGEKVYCHQCRRATDAEKMTCTNMLTEGDPCRRKYCSLCILKRYPDIEFDSYATMFICPSCMGTCNCTVCCAKRNEPYISTRSVKIDKKILDQIESGHAPGILPSASAEYLRLLKQIGPLKSLRNQAIPKENRPGARRSQPKPNVKQPQASGSQPSKRDELAAMKKTGEIIENSGATSGEYWGAVFSITGDRIGAGYIGQSTTQIIVKPPEDVPKPKKKKRRIYIGQLQESWGLSESGEEIEPDEPSVRAGKGKGKARAQDRQYVGDRSILFRYKDKSLQLAPSCTMPDPAPPPIETTVEIQSEQYLLDLAELGSDADAEGEDDDEMEGTHWLMTAVVDSSPIRSTPAVREMSEEDMRLAIFRAIDAVNAEDNLIRY